MSSSTLWPCVAIREASLAERTTMRVGGRVEWLLEPTTPDELAAANAAARDRGLRPRVLGGGANVVIDDGLLPGVVISTERLRRVFRPLAGEAGAESETLDAEVTPAAIAPPDPAQDPRLVVWCGATLPALLRAARDLGYSGLEGIVGVPGYVGGGVAMNAGGRWGEMWDVIESVRVIDEDGELRDLARDECTPSYRNANLGERIVVGAVLRFHPEPVLVIRERMRDYLVQKNAVQPVTEWSAGCVFKNPDPERSEGRSAGKLVDDCGGKGLERGEAIVSPLHGNFIVNRGKATAVDVFTLMEDVQDLVAQKTGIRLEFEVKRWRPSDPRE
ncbi:MAG: FAD-binding protein [bacterium]|nr:FAD-binding protein [bacterium]